jgi:hypothetical protein
MATASRSVRSEDVRHLLLELVAGDAVSDEVKSAVPSQKWWKFAVV